MVPLSMAILIASSPGQTFGISIFTESIRTALGLSHGQLAAAYTLGTLLGAVPITLIGHQMDRHGLRRTLLVVIGLFCLTCGFMSLVQGWLTLVTAFCLLRMLGPGALAFLSGNALPFWFEQRLGFVEGLRQVGMAAAMACIPAFHLWLLNQWGWRGAYLLLGTGIGLLLLPAVALLFRNRPADINQPFEGRPLPGDGHPAPDQAERLLGGLTLGQTLQTPTFWIVLSGAAMFSMIHTGLFFCMVPILDERGLSTADAAATFTVFAVCLAAMRLVSGVLADRLHARYLLFVGMLGLGVAPALLLFTQGRAMAFATGVGMAVSQAVFFGTSQPLWARYFGRRHLGKIRGVLMTSNVASSSLGPFVAGLTRDAFGNFDPALMVFAVLPLSISLLSLRVTPPRWDVMPSVATPSVGAGDSPRRADPSAREDAG